MKDLFKYFTKLIAKRRDQSEGQRIAPVAALDVIFCAMKGRRVYQPMGFKLPPTVQDPDEQLEHLTASIELEAGPNSCWWEWIQDQHDWVKTLSGELLTGYHPVPGYSELVSSIGTTALPDLSAPR
jgi:hypothetical protein